MLQNIKSALAGCFTRAQKALAKPSRMQMLMIMLMVGTVAFAQNTAGNYAAGTTALGTVTTEIAKYVPIVVKLCYAIAGVVAVVGAISVYIKMNNEEQDVKNILLHCFAAEYKRKKMLHKTLYVRLIDRYFCFSDFCRSNY